ncbi:heme biosynthesis HemY N-terminal domain-containing protein [Vibrio gazogenes]|uniref:HemY protein n=1 Tax=Vibrio gazogenes DSM 21264 = NBRC 103151 TaxID=1123492 RepID=A0A1M5BSD5_VIBGA|nr:heme biosynthesis HemY N-terminal domain-containing protein [Vibrio gazogenes]USP13674.1 heme biosynthesis protein HemY [Vibrio gazogenes]SHF45428.1 HemY protein [Vibrio gazogenes DSM 21264] [Vibrio gazogenes DSM 21264 = NBRC 103151]SJN54460.1 putative protoheme IX biogenesis protein [Vibrio gazogenes]
MIRAIFLFAVLGIGLYVGTQYSGQQGYVLISIANKTIEMSVTTLILLVIALLAVLFGIEFLIKKALHISSSTWNWFGSRKLKQSRRDTNEGIVKLIEGDWKQAEKKVTRLAKNHDMPLLCYLIASEAALEQGNQEKRDHYLSLAAKQENSTLAVKLTKARQFTKEQRYQDALNVLSDVAIQHPDNPVVVSLLKTTYHHLRQWQPLLGLMPQLRKLKLAGEEEIIRLEIESRSHLMEQAAAIRGKETLTEYWKDLPKRLKNTPELMVCYVQLLLKHQGDEEAFSLLKEHIKKHPNSNSYPLLPEINLESRQPIIKLLQNVIRKDEQHAEAHSALGQLYFQEKKLPLAQGHLEKALQIRNSISDYQLLAQVLEQQDMSQAAHHVSKKALSLIEPTS